MSTPDLHTFVISLQPSLLSEAAALTPNIDDAHDLVQDTILTALSSENIPARPSNIGSWLVTILKHLFHNEYHRERKLGVGFDSWDESNALQMARHSVVGSPEDAVLSADITDALAMLDEDNRRLFSLHLAGYKYVEIARRMQLPLGTVKSRIWQVRNRMQQLLADYRTEVD